jgi:hypothetical protein
MKVRRIGLVSVAAALTLDELMNAAQDRWTKRPTRGER